MMREGDGYNQLQIERAREDKLGNLSVCSCVQLRAPPRGVVCLVMTRVLVLQELI